MQCLMHFVSVLDNHPLSEKVKAMFGGAKSENQDVKHQYMTCDISRCVVTFQDEVHSHKRH